MPPSLAGAVVRQLDAAGGLAQAVLQVGAVLDEPFAPLDVVRALDACVRDVVAELERLVQRGFLHADGDGLAFRQPVVREAVAGTVSVPRRALVRARGSGADRVLATGRG